MPPKLNPGNSAYDVAIDEVHPIKPYHQMLRKEGYKYAGSKRDVLGERENTYEASGKPKVTLTASHQGFKEIEAPAWAKAMSGTGVATSYQGFREKKPHISSRLYNPEAAHEGEYTREDWLKERVPYNKMWVSKGYPEPGVENLQKGIQKYKKRIQ